MALWAISPDLFAFTPAVLWMLWQILYLGVDFRDVPRPEIMPFEVRNTFFIFRLTDHLYHISHSIFTFLALFFLVLIIYRFKITHAQKSDKTFSKNTYHRTSRYTPYWEMTGWLIHIITDIPTHSAAFYPTLFLWPLSDWCVDGTSWANVRFMITNYTSLLMVFLLLRVVAQVRTRQNR